MGSAGGDGRPTVLVIASTYPRWRGDHEPGFVHELSRRLIDRYRVVVLCPHAAGAAVRESLDGVEVVRFRYAPARWERLVHDGGMIANLRRSPWLHALLPGFALLQLLAAMRLIRRCGVDLVHAHWLLPQGLLAALAIALRRRRPRLIVTSHGADVFALRGAVAARLKRWVVARSTRLTVVSDAMRAPVLALGAAPGRLDVRPMGVDLQHRFTPDPACERDPHELLFVGRLVEKKGVRHLLDALARLLPDLPGLRLTVAGFGPELEPLRAQAQSLGISDRVDFLGAVPQADLPALYRRAALFVAPFVQARDGDQEGLGLVSVEAIGCGCPVIASDLPAVRDVPVERVPPADPAALAAAIDRLLGLPPDARAALAARQRAAISAQFDWTAVAAGYAALYAQALESPP